MILTKKRRLRLEIRQKTALMSRQEKILQSAMVFSRVEKTEVFKKARNIGFFWSLTDEIPTQEVIQKWTKRKNIYLPQIDGDGLNFVRFTEGCKMDEGDFRILVPTGTECIDPAELDLLIVPGVAFDSVGRRLGKGKGYYDRFMQENRIFTLGVCLGHQIVAQVPAEPHDRKVDMVVFPEGLFILIDTARPRKAGDSFCRSDVERHLHDTTA